jgi:serine/threonine protein phosphatase 1
MLQKFFVFSDVHGHFTELQKALNDAGYDPENENHHLISCGDNFDRGSENLKMLHFLRNSPRIVTVRGNHETLLKDLIRRCSFQMYDWSNGTAETVYEFSGMTDCVQTTPVINAAEAKTQIISFIDKMPWYYETENYIFVHAWIAGEENWREAHSKSWDEASWSSPISLFNRGKLHGVDGKTIVFGHWHCSDLHYKIEGEFGNHNPFYGDNVIGIDPCAILSKKVNVLVVEDYLLEETE